MAKRWKYIRAALAQAGYTTIGSADGITIDSIDNDGYVHYFLEDGSEVKARYDVNLGLAVETDTIEIFVGDVTAMDVDDTQQIIVTNEDGVNVNSECTFTSSDTDKIIVDSDGLMTAVSIGIALVDVEHNDSPIASTRVITIS